jgi:uncharacterized protein involved in exopolysaccharide biosynthesis
MNDKIHYKDDDINLRELVITLWTHKIFIFIFTLGIAIASFFYASSIDKTYSARNLFRIEAPKTLGIQLPEEMQALGKLAGVGKNNGINLKGLKERVMARIFIEKLDNKIDLKSDNFFNTYNPNYIEPIWKSTLKNILRINNQVSNVDEVIWASIIEEYKNNVSLIITKANNISIEAVHINPSRAAQIANEMMNIIITDHIEKEKLRSDVQIKYLTGIVAESLLELDQIQTDLESFTINNSSMPFENLAAASIIYDRAKQELEQTNVYINAINEMINITESKETNASAYKFLNEKHPIVDNVKFRRIFGQSEIISQWTWPKLETITAISQTMRDRKKGLENDVYNYKLNTDKLTVAANTYSELKRKVTLAEATYTVMIEQVKTVTLQSGFRPNQTEIYEFAIEPIYQSAPNRNMVIGIGIIFGFLISSILVMIFSNLRGVYYSTTSLLVNHPADYVAKSRTLNKISRKNLKQLHTNVKMLKVRKLREIKLEINHIANKIVLISQVGSRLRARGLSHLLGINMQFDGERIACIDFSYVYKAHEIESLEVNKHGFLILEEYENLSVLTPEKEQYPMNFLTKKNSQKSFDDLKNEYDRIIISVKNEDAISVGRFLNPKETFHIILTQKNKTKRKLLENICSVLPIKAHLHG